ncbi:MAG: hypothetical protein IJ762_10940 [Bacteroidaceae bacterium]|nr:hypothetical protein [Bacteroidaceae bacterium]
MNVRIEKPIRKGEQRHGVLSREMNGAVCFDETDQQWLNNPVRRSVRLKRFPLGTRVSRKADRLKLTLEFHMSGVTALDLISASAELTDALLYCSAYMERRNRP